MALKTLAALSIDHVPLLIKSVSRPQEDGSVSSVEQRLINPFTIMLEIAKGCYLEDILFHKADSMERIEISQSVETIGRLQG